MTIISASPLTSPTVDNLTTDGNTASTGILLRWRILPNTLHFQTEIWASLTNNRANASLIGSVSGNSFFHIVPPNINYFYWIRGVTTYNKPSGDWFPTSPTTGVSGIAALISTRDISPNAVTEINFGFSSTGPAGAGINSFFALITGTIHNPGNEVFPFYLNLFAKQTYSAGTRQTSAMFRDNTLAQIVVNWGIYNNMNEMLALSLVWQIPANTSRQISFLWAGEDNTVSLSNMSCQILGIKR